MSNLQTILGTDEIDFTLTGSSGLTISPNILNEDNTSATFTLATNL